MNSCYHPLRSLRLQCTYEQFQYNTLLAAYHMHAPTQWHWLAYSHMHARMYVHTHTHTHAQTHVRTHTHTHKHMYTHTCMHTFLTVLLDLSFSLILLLTLLISGRVLESYSELDDTCTLDTDIIIQVWGSIVMGGRGIYSGTYINRNSYYFSNYHTAENFGEGKLWRIWRFGISFIRQLLVISEKAIEAGLKSA